MKISERIFLAAVRIIQSRKSKSTASLLLGIILFMLLLPVFYGFFMAGSLLLSRKRYSVDFT
jgi:hypothetical protein